MLTNLIKFYFIFFCIIFIFLKIAKCNLKHSILILYKYIFPLILAYISSFLKIYKTDFAYIVPFLLFWFTATLCTSTPKLSFVIATISFGISYGLFALSGFIAHMIIYPIYCNVHPFPYTKLALTTATFQILLTSILFRKKRFKNGMPFLISTAFINTATSISLFLLAFLIYVPYIRDNLNVLILTPFLFIIVLAFLIHWWQAQITKSYKQALIQRELESLRTELQEKDRLLAELSTKNEELGRLIHKDNKRIPAMEHAVSEFLIMDFDDKETAIERANALLLEIKELAQDRDHTITEIYAKKFKHHNTGLSSLDTMLNYMEKRAHGEHIKLSVNIALDLNGFIPNTIAIEDLTHVLSDLLENAIIAAKQNASPVIQLQFYQAGKDFVIEIADNGNPFEANILVNYGLEQLTTHADTGGSGIGLMDIWKIKEKYGTSLHITEYESDAPYTKKIALIFNKKNRYTISSTRKDELMQLSKRTDLQIF